MGPSDLLNVCARTCCGEVKTNAQTHASCKSVANQNFEIFMRLVISQQRVERNTGGRDADGDLQGGIFDVD